MSDCRKSLIVCLIGLTAVCFIFSTGYKLGSFGSEMVTKSSIVGDIADTEDMPTYLGKHKFVPANLQKVSADEYFQVLEQVYQMVPDISCIQTLSFEQIQEIVTALKNSPDIFWIDEISVQESLPEKGRPYQMHIKYAYTTPVRNQMIEDIESKAAEIISLDDKYICPKSSEHFISNICGWFQKHTQYAYTTPYDSEQAISNAHLQGPLLDQKAICSGYAKAFCYILGKAGYDTGYCIGKIDGESHAWCSIKDGDRVLYVDPTACVTTNEIVMSYTQDFESGYILDCVYWYNAIPFLAKE